MGVFCLGPGANPDLRGSDVTFGYGRNDVLDFRYYGVRAQDAANPNLGSGTVATANTAGRNNIFSRADSTTVFVWNGGPNAISAKYNYWANTKPDTMASRFVGAVSPGLAANEFLSVFETSAGPTFIYPGYLPAPALQSPSDLYDATVQRMERGDAAGALETFEYIVDNYPSDPVSVNALVALVSRAMEAGGAAETIMKLRTLAKASAVPNLRFMAKRLLPRMELKLGDAAAAASAYKDVLQEPQVDKGSVLLEMAFGNALVLNDRGSARANIQELQLCCADYGLLKHARAMLEDYVGSDLWIDLPAPMPGRVVESERVTEDVSLELGTPNPMNPSGTIAFSIPRSAQARLRVFDLHGRLVRTLIDQVLPRGRHVARWDGRSTSGGTVASGMYFYRLEALGKSISRKIIVLK